jgi:hypothetical protein
MIIIIIFGIIFGEETSEMIDTLGASLCMVVKLGHFGK